MDRPRSATEAGAGVRRGRTGAAVAASFLAHVAVLAWLSLRIAAPPARQPADVPEFQVELTRRPPASPTAEVVRPEAHPAPSATPRALSPAVATPASPSAARPPTPKAAVSAPPTAPATAPGPSAPPPGLGAGAGLLAGPAASDMHGVLRGALGCAHAEFLHLDAAERARCAERLGLASRTAPRIDPIPAEKRAYYDAVAAAYADIHFYNTPSAPAFAHGSGPQGALDDPRYGSAPGQMPHVGCSPLLLTKGVKTPPHSLKLGPCIITPPQGTFTEEANVAEPPTLRERQADEVHMKRLDAPR